MATVRTPTSAPVARDERRHAIGRLAGRRIARDRRAARVVAVEAEAGVDVELGAVERADDRRRLSG